MNTSLSLNSQEIWAVSGLEVLDSQASYLIIRLFLYPLHNYPSLTFLSSSASFAPGKDALIAMSTRCGQLRSLDMTRCITNVASGRFLVQLAANCPLLEDVVLDGCACDDDAVRAIVSSCPRLSKLNLANNSAISDAALDHIANLAAKLQILSVDRRQIVRFGRRQIARFGSRCARPSVHLFID